MQVRTNVYIYVQYVRMYIHTFICMYIQYVNIFICMCVSIYVSTYVCTQVYNVKVSVIKQGLRIYMHTFSVS